MTVIDILKDFYLHLKVNRIWKEEHWQFRKSNTDIHFGHKPHIFDFFVFLKEDRRTYIIDEQGTKKITNEEWEWLFSQLKANNKDVLFVFRDEDRRKEKDYIRTMATGNESNKMKNLYDGLIHYHDFNYGIEHGHDSKKGHDYIVVPIKNRRYPVNVTFDWSNLSVILEDELRRLRKVFFEVDELQEYMKRIKK